MSEVSASAEPPVAKIANNMVGAFNCRTKA
jgi:hypothetical protein